MLRENNRKQFKHEGKIIYEWEETLDSIIVFIEPPPIPAQIKIKSVMDVKFSPKELKVGIKGNPPYLCHQTNGIIDCDESVWYVHDGKEKGKKQIVIEIQKAQKATNWGGVFKGHQVLNPVEEEELKKKIMLERFQEEHPGFDFSGADFNGRVPDARTFMGGMRE